MSDRKEEMNPFSLSIKNLRAFVHTKRITLKGVVERKILKKFRPEIFMVETSLACDLACPECAIGSGRIVRPRGFMTFEDFKIIADRIRPYAKYTFLHCWGEPMLNPDIIRIIRYASAFSTTNISTNCKSLTPQRAEELITSGVTDLVVSVDGTTQEVYETYRVGGVLAQTLDRLRLLQELNVRHGSRVNISPQFVVFAHNRHQMDDFRRICGELGLEPEFKAPYIRENSIFRNADDPKYVRTVFPDRRAAVRAMRNCQDPVKVMTILRDGTVVACCYDHNGVRSFGNLFLEDVMTIWNSPGYREFRHNVLTGKGDEFCLGHCLEYIWKRDG